jgi:hypothetical protein
MDGMDGMDGMDDRVPGFGSDRVLIHGIASYIYARESA